MPGPDRCLRAVTDDGAFRVITLRTDDTVRAAAAAQGVAGPVARRFGELLTGAILFRETMAPRLRVQCILEGEAGDGRLVADAHPDGGTRGLVMPGRTAAGTGTAPARLRLSRALPDGRLQEGVVEVAGGASMSEALMTYMQESEQVLSVLAVGTLGEGDRMAAGGWLVQLLPEADRSALGDMTGRLEAFAGIDACLAEDASPDQLLERLLAGVPHTRTEEAALRFQCRCSQERVEAAIAILAREDLEAALADGEPLDVRCDYCRASYVVPLALLERLLQPPDRVH